MGRPPKSLLKDSHPELAAQLVDQMLTSTLATGSDKKVEWRCERGHTWFASPCNRTNAKNRTGCPICSGRKVMPGVNDLATLRPDIAKLAVDQNIVHTVTTQSNKTLEWRCEHGHTWFAPVARLTTQNSRCPYCSGRLPIVGKNDLATTHPNLAAELVDKSLATKLKAGSSRKVMWRCSKGHVYEATPNDRVNGNRNCPYCSNHRVALGKNDLATTHPGIASHLLNPDDAKLISAGSDRKLIWVCAIDSRHTWSATVANYRRGGCPYCANKKILIGQNDLATTHPELAAELVNQSLATKLVAGSTKKVEWQCSKGHIWTTSVSSRTGTHATGCPVCNKRSTSLAEKDLVQVVHALLPNESILENDQTVLPGKYELDIVIPDKHIAIEFNGCVWHSEKMMHDRLRHKHKHDMAKQAGYQLIQVWEDDWSLRRDAVIRALAAKLHALENLPLVLDTFDPKMTERIGARKLTAERINGQLAHAFLNDNHTQGAVTATRHYGLFDAQHELRAVLSIRSPRNNARMHRAPGTWEVQRYATCGVIAGGFTKLLSFAEHDLLSDPNITLTQWVSFSANDISDGSMYAKTGFTFDAEIPPNYFYVGNSNNWVREPKEKYQRKKFRTDPKLLWDESWTEHQAALENKLYRAYDSGKIRWIKTVMCAS